MSTRLQIILVSVIALMAALGFVATQLVLQQPVHSLTSRMSNQVASSAATYQVSTSTAIELTFKGIETPSTLLAAYQHDARFDEMDTAVLVSKNVGGRKTYFLWFDDQVLHGVFESSPKLVKSFDDTYASNPSLAQDNSGLALTVGDPSNPYSFEYDRYEWHGYTEFSYLLRGDEDVTITNSDDKVYSISPIFSSDCEQVFYNQEASKVTMKGIMIDGVAYPLEGVEVSCMYGDGENAGLIRPRMSFVEYDPVYSILTVKLPGDKTVMIDVLTKKIVTTKEIYNMSCSSDDSSSDGTLSVTTPDGTKVLATDIFSDPVLLNGVNGMPYDSLCLEWARNGEDAYPKYDLYGNYTEARQLIGEYTFNLKTGKFQK